MQHNKSTKKIEQIEKVANNPERIIDNINSVIEKFEIKKRLKSIDMIKRSGMLISDATISLLLLPFIGMVSINAFFKAGFNQVNSGKKNAYYDIKNNPKINWRALLLFVAQRFKSIISKDNALIAELEAERKRIKAFVFDDTTLSKTGKHIEGIGYVFDHVQHLHILGFKLLACGFFDGVSFIPLDFYLLHESRNNKKKKLMERIEKKKVKLKNKQVAIKDIRKKLSKSKQELSIAKQRNTTHPTKTNEHILHRKIRVQERIIQKKDRLLKEIDNLKKEIEHLENELFELKSIHNGLSQKEYKEQWRKTREKNSSGYRRKAELSMNKIDAVIKMIKRIIKKGFEADYVLTDSWFFSEKLLRFVLSLKSNIHLVSMAKIGKAKYEILPEGKSLNPQEIITRYERKQGHYSKKYKAEYIRLTAKYQGIRVQIFLIKFGKNSKWRLLVTSDLKINFTQLMDVYKIRWTIEVFFKESKQYLLLGKSQSQDLDAQISDITMSLIRYILLSYYERIHYGMTIGEIFREISQRSLKENILEDISYYFIELLKFFADNAGVDFISFYEDLIRDERAGKIIELFVRNPEKQVA